MSAQNSAPPGGPGPFDDSWPSDAPRSVGQEIDEVNLIVAKHFPVYDIRVGHSALVFRVSAEQKELDERFIKLKDALFAKGYIPMLTKDGEDSVLVVTRKPPAKHRTIAINIVLLLLTLLTTILAGAWAYAIYDGKITLQSDLSLVARYFASPQYLLLGAVFFAVPLMTILGIHELGHYWMARRHGVAASLPFFMPVPPYPFSPLGTFGAFISVREPIPNKKALLDIGIAGPIAGFVVAMPVTIAGLWLTGHFAHPASKDVLDFFLPGDSALFIFMAMLFPGTGSYMLHPMAFAGWVGLLVTAINLLPAGQLDGGHIAQALFGHRARYLSYVAVGALLVMGIFNASWFIFAFLIILLGLRHPPPLNDLTGLDSRRKAAGALAIALLIVCFVPSPLTIQEAQYDFALSAHPGEGANRTVFVNSSFVCNFTIANAGNTVENFTVRAEIRPSAFPPWSYLFHQRGRVSPASPELEKDLKVGQCANYTLMVFVPNNSSYMNRTYEVRVLATVGGNTKDITFIVRVANYTVDGALPQSHACARSLLPVNAEMPGEGPVHAHGVDAQKAQAEILPAAQPREFCLRQDY